MNTKPINILGFSVDPDISNLNLDSTRVIVNTINPHSYCVTKRDHLFRETLMHSDVLIPDGIGIVLAAKILKKGKIKKIAGADLHAHLQKKANDTSAKVFYLGSSTKTLTLIENRLQKDYPNIRFQTYSPPYKPSFTAEENRAMIEAINDFNPNVLFIGMTAPKQEKWAYQNKDKINANIIASIGAVFDFYAGTVKRPGKKWQKLGLEWLPRLISEPKRLWRRTFISTPCFLKDVLIFQLCHKK
ncbi:MAG: WecB/TagA/CpsF family glycosyltransferase [Bacteroidota bacterium]